MTTSDDSTPLTNDSAREASDSMRGYWAQIWRSVLVWLELGATERLYLEGAEDLDRVSGPDAETIQVKDTAGNITLRSPDVVEAIDNAFGHQQRNPQRTIRFRFLTTSGIGSEQGVPFKDRTPGLELWRICRESNDAAQSELDARAIADFLLAEGKVSATVQAFLRSATNAEIKQNLICAIEWDTSADDASQVIRAVKDGLVVLGQASGVPPQSAEAVADHLYATAFVTATRREARYLTRADLLRAFADKTRVSLPAATVAALVAAIPKHLAPEGALAAQAQLTKWCEERSIPLCVYRWDDACESAGLEPNALYLLRPDTYVALADAAGDFAAVERYFTDRAIRVGT